MQVVGCPKCGAGNRVDESRLQTSEAKCGHCGTLLSVTASRKPIEVTDNTFANVVLGRTGTPILVDCWAAWCGPCRAIAPIMDELAAEANGRYAIGKLNVDENQTTSQQFKISSIPTMLIFKDGKLVDRIVGVLPKSAILTRLNARSK
jgi:thioredoxin 2